MSQEHLSQRLATDNKISRRLMLAGLGIGGAGLLMANEAEAYSGRRARRRGGRVLGRSRHGRHVLILGGGLAGLAAAYELAKAGHRVTILEGSNRIGGRIHTVRAGDEIVLNDGSVQHCNYVDDGRFFEAGAMRISHVHQTLLGYLREFRVPLQAFTDYNSASYLYTDGGPTAGTRLKYGNVLATVQGYFAQFLSEAISGGYTPTGVDPQALNELLDLWGPLEGGQYVGSSRAGYSVQPGPGLQTGTLNPIPAPQEVIDIMNRLMPDGPGFSPIDSGPIGVYDWQPTMLHPVDGMTAVVDAFVREVEALGVTIHTSSRITKVRQNDSRVKAVVETPRGTRTVRGDYLLTTALPQVLKRIDLDVSRRTQRALESAMPISANKVGLEMKDRFWETGDDIYAGQTLIDLPSTTIVYPSQRYLQPGGVLIGLYNVFGVMPNATANELIQQALTDGEKVHPEYRTQFRSAMAMNWLRAPGVNGMSALFDGDSASPDYRHLLEPDGRILFSGDWLTNAFAWMNSSIESALQAVHTIAQLAERDDDDDDDDDDR